MRRSTKTQATRPGGLTSFLCFWKIAIERQCGDFGAVLGRPMSDTFGIGEGPETEGN